MSLVGRLSALLLAILLAACGPGGGPGSGSALRIAVTTSTRDSGLLDALFPHFEERYGQRVDVIAAGTGKALKLGEQGEVDLVLVHSRLDEDAFMAAGHGVRREDVMYNEFVLLGPQADPAGVRGLPVVEALAAIAASGQRFVSRGDDSGTHKRELLLWELAGGRPEWDGYMESGQGQGRTLIIADEREAYALSDRGSFLRFRSKLELLSLAQATEDLRNPYGILLVDPSKNAHINAGGARLMLDFLISPDAQRMIRDYRVEGDPLFHPLHLASGASSPTVHGG